MILSIRDFDLLNKNQGVHFYPLIGNQRINDFFCMTSGSLILNDAVAIQWSAKERKKDSMLDFELYVTGFARDSMEVIFRAKCCCVNLSRIYLEFGEAAVIDYFSMGTDWTDFCHNVFSIDPIHDDCDLMDFEDLHDRMINHVNSRFNTDYGSIIELPEMVLIDFIQKMPDHPQAHHANVGVINKAIVASLHDAGNGPDLLVALRPSPLQYCIPEKYWKAFGLNRFNCSDRANHTDKLTKLYEANGFASFDAKPCARNTGWSVPDNEPAMMFSMIKPH